MPPLILACRPLQGAISLPPPPATAVDLISQFNDDVLLHILGFLPAARDVARTSVPSRRWRHLWSIAPCPCYRFAVGDGDGGDNGDRDAHAARLLIAAVDATVARCADIDILEISFRYGSSRPWSFYEQPCADVMSSHSRAATWLRFAGRHVRRSFAVDLPPLGWRRDHQAAAVVTSDLAELPSSARVGTMRLQLGHATLTVPVAGTYSALTDYFELHQATLAGAGGGNLGHLVSSSCSPRLRRLRLAFVHGLVELRLHAAGTLEELELVELPDLRRLDVGAPGLRLLHVDLFDMNYSNPTPVRISAPRLEALACDDLLSPAQLHFDGAAAVRHIKKLVFYYPVDDMLLNATTIWLLNNCTAMDHLELDLVIDMPHTESEWPIGEDIMNDVPELPSVTNLAISTYVQLGGHTIGATLTKFIEKCKNVEYISIGFNDLSRKYMHCLDPSCFCRQLEGWEDRKISLDHLRMVDILDFMPSDDWICLVQLLANSSALDTVMVEFDKIYLKEIQKEHKGVQFDIPCSKGFWAFVFSQSDEHGFNSVVKYKWTRGAD